MKTIEQLVCEKIRTNLHIDSSVQYTRVYYNYLYECYIFAKFVRLKVVGNEKEGGSRRWQMIGIGLRPRRSRFVCLIILLSSLILCISVSAPGKQNE